MLRDWVNPTEPPMRSLALAEEAGQDVPEVQLEAAVAAHLAGRLDLASELSQRLDAAYRSIYEGRIR